MSIKYIPLVVLATGLLGCEGNTPAPEKPSRVVNVIQLQTPSSVQKLRFSGVIQSHQNAELAFRVNGTLDEILVKEGEQVQAGQVLARLDPHDFKVNINELQARLDEAKAAHQLAKIEFERTRLASQDGAIASVSLDRAHSAQSRAKASVDMLTQSLKKAKDALRYSELKAPFDGVIGQIYADEFEQTSPSRSILAMHQPNTLEALVDVPENSISQINKGMTGKVTWYGQEKGVDASVVEIATLPHQLKRTYEVTFSLNQNNQSLFSGKPVHVELALEGAKRGFCLPSTAINQQMAHSFVYQVVDKQVHAMPVIVHSQKADALCVTGNLNQGDYIVTNGSAYLSEGQIIDQVREVK